MINMRILMLTTNNTLIDGINRHILAISKGLKSLGNEVAVCIVQSGGDLGQALDDAGIHVYSFGCRNGHDPRLLWRFWNVMCSFKPDIVHVHVLALMERIMLSCFFRRVPKVFTTHGISDSVPVEHIRQKLERFILRMTPLHNVHGIYISEGVRRHYAGNGPVVYNPIEVKECVESHKLHDELGIPADVPIIGTACRFADPPKKPLVFIEVMCQVLNQFPSAHAVLVGDGEPDIKQKMRNLISSHKMEARIHWLGYRKDAPELIGELSMFIMTSRWEGMPTALLEAMSQSTPIAFLKGEGGLVDLAEMDERYVGIAVIAESPSELASGIVKCLNDKETCRCMAKRALDVVKKHFSLEVNAFKLFDAYNRIARGGK